jgi:acyl-CoA synthetase (AMP-forming)/AMP-acid ligase II
MNGVPRYGVPEQIVFVEALRKTGGGKLDKKVLRDRSAGLEGISLLSNDPHNRLDLQEVP